MKQLQFCVEEIRRVIWDMVGEELGQLPADTSLFVDRSRRLLRDLFSDVTDRPEYREFERGVLEEIEREHREKRKLLDELFPNQST